MVGDDKKARSSIWRNRGLRFVTLVNVVISILLAAVLLVMVNYFANSHPMRWDISWTGYYRLSQKSKSLIASIDQKVKIIVVFNKGNEVYEDIRNLLKEYQYEDEKRPVRQLDIELVDPESDLARTREISQQYGLEDSNTVIFECNGRNKYVSLKDIVDYDTTADLSTGKVDQKLSGFKGERAFSSAIQNVVQSKTPVIYFLSGHGERNFLDYSEHAGYSRIAKVMREDNIEIKSLVLGKEKNIPADCTALVVAGADRKLSTPEVDIIADYLNRNGRMMCLVDPATTTGLEGLLMDWGVKLASDVVVGLTITGRELVVARYEAHPITRNMKDITTMFYMPRSVESAIKVDAKDARQADKPKVTRLAYTSDKGWAEFDLNQNPAKFNEGVDRPGPISVAVAVEKGSVGSIDMQVKPTRIVVIGDSSFVSNGALKLGVGGNVDFFMSSINWLAERSALMEIAPKVPGCLKLEMNRDQKRVAFFALSGALPAIVALLGIMVWIKRRK